MRALVNLRFILWAFCVDLSGAAAKASGVSGVPNVAAALASPQLLGAAQRAKQSAEAGAAASAGKEAAPTMLSSPQVTCPTDLRLSCFLLACFLSSKHYSVALPARKHLHKRIFNTYITLINNTLFIHNKKCWSFYCEGVLQGSLVRSHIQQKWLSERRQRGVVSSAFSVLRGWAECSQNQGHGLVF